MPGWLRLEQVAGLRRNRWLASSESAANKRFPALARQTHLLVGCGKTPCKIRHRFDFLRPEQARRERLSDAREGSSEGSPGRPREPGGDGAGGSSTAADPPAGERSPGASVTCLR